MRAFLSDLGGSPARSAEIVRHLDKIDGYRSWSSEAWEILAGFYPYSKASISREDDGLANTFRDPELMIREGRRLERWIDSLARDSKDAPTG